MLGAQRCTFSRKRWEAVLSAPLSLQWQRVFLWKDSVPFLIELVTGRFGYLSSSETSESQLRQAKAWFVALGGSDRKRGRRDEEPKMRFKDWREF